MTKLKSLKRKTRACTNNQKGDIMTKEELLKLGRSGTEGSAYCLENVSCSGCIGCYDCYDCLNCHDCTDCIDCVGCESCKYTRDSSDCYMCISCKNCVNSRHCVNCEGLNGRSYVVHGYQFTISEYNIFMNS